MATPPDIKPGMKDTLTLPALPDTIVEVVGPAHPMGTWVTFRAWGFDTEDAARAAGEKLGDALTMVGAIEKLGIDLGFSRSTLRFSQDVLDAMRRVDGRETRTEVHGLMTYQKDTVRIIGTDARGSATIATGQLQSHVARWLPGATPLTERQRTCAALLNDSHFAASLEAQFILCVSAVEALCEQGPAADAYNDLVDDLLKRLGTMSAEQELRAKLASHLHNAKRQSIGESFREKFLKHLGQDQAAAFTKLYRLRSSFLHDGQGRGDLQPHANEARDLATALLAAEVEI
jgi:hypothetical protein